jgi:hypothetical protein
VSQTKNGRNEPENQFHTHNLRGKSANNGARYGPNFAYALGELKLTGLAAAEERLNAHRYPPTVRAHTFEFTPPPQRDTPARSFAKVADFGARFVIDSRNSLKLAAKRAQLITIVAANEPVKQLGTQINLSSLIALIVRPQPHTVHNELLHA